MNTVVVMETNSQDRASCERKDGLECQLASCKSVYEAQDWCIVSYDRRRGKSGTTTTRDSAVQCDLMGSNATVEGAASAQRVQQMAAPQTFQLAHEERAAKVDMMGEYVLTHFADPTTPVF